MLLHPGRNRAVDPGALNDHASGIAHYDLSSTGPVKSQNKMSLESVHHKLETVYLELRLNMSRGTRKPHE